MDVLCIAPCKRKLPSGATVTHPLNWSGEVPEADGLRWISEGTAQRIGAVLQPGQQFTADQAAVLAYVADEAIRQAIEANAAGGEQVDPETGEITEADLEESTEVVEVADETGAGEAVAAEPEAVDLDALSLEDLRDLAKFNKVPKAGSLGRAKLLEALKALKPAA